jgi:hypothetical protein
MNDEDPAPSGHELLGTKPGPFAHPQWAVGMVLVLALPFLVLGAFGHPIWLLIGSPFILVLVIWAAVRLIQLARSGQP